MSQPLKVGLVGYGFHGQTIHDAIERTPGMRLAAALEPDILKHESIRGGMAVYTDLQEFMRHPGLDGVIIASPVNTHKQVVEAAVRAGIAAIELENLWPSLTRMRTKSRV